MAGEPLELLRDVEGAPRHRIAIALGLQARLVVDGALERDRVRRILRHELAELVDLAVGHLQHAADVAQDAARLQGAEGDDLRHLLAAVFLLHVVDHFVAAVLAEVDVEVRHRDALGIEEALEQQPEADRIEVGDGERVGDQRAGAGAAARPDRNALRLRPLDEIGDDQKIAGILHLLDHAELEGQPVVVFLDGVAGRERMALEPLLQAGARGATELLRLVHCLGRLALAGREARQDRRQRPRPKRAALGDLDGGGERLGQIGEQRRHFGAGLEAMFGGELAAVAVGNQPALSDAEQRIVRFVVLARGEERLVGRHERQPARIGKVNQSRFGDALGRHAVALQFDIEPVAEQLL